MRLFAACAVAAIGLSLGATGAPAQSFNCNYAKTPDEVLICQVPRLSDLDERMSSLYFRLRNSLSGRPLRTLDADQKEWLAERMACGRDIACIAEAYGRRIRQLKEF